MAGVRFTIDAKQFYTRLNVLEKRAVLAASAGLADVTNEVLRLSSFEVPHDTGWLQTHGTVQRTGKLEYQVGYNTPYAARLHEHPEYRFQKGRKGKFLEDPIKSNLVVLGKYYTESVSRRLTSG